MNEYDFGRLTEVKNKLDKLAACDIDSQKMEANAILGFLQGYVGSWIDHARKVLDVSDAILSSKIEDKMSGCCDAPITETGFCTECKENV